MLSTLMAHEAQLSPVTGNVFITDSAIGFVFRDKVKTCPFIGSFPVIAIRLTDYQAKSWATGLTSFTISIESQCLPPGFSPGENNAPIPTGFSPKAGGNKPDLRILLTRRI
jgi:hypothetical protein